MVRSTIELWQRNGSQANRGIELRETPIYWPIAIPRPGLS